ncbi:MAG: crossover junction endodeoxyribonuclease RuvC [Proteobacteria bacterium]|nr:crossover junction endodeoxyribonuclease RuvC [Pseudomonadota bacterium]
MSALPVRVFGVDPGGFCTGWGLVQRTGSRIEHIDSGLIRPPRKAVFAERLAFLHKELTAVLARTSPDHFAIEAVFHAEHARSALQLGHARGVLVLAAAQAGLTVREYPPATVKKAVTGSGAADKEQVRRMVEMLLKEELDGAADRTDALAVAICHAHVGDFKAKVKAAEDAAKGGGPKKPLRKVRG